MRVPRVFLLGAMLGLAMGTAASLVVGRVLGSRSDDAALPDGARVPAVPNPTDSDVTRRADGAFGATGTSGVAPAYGRDREAPASEATARPTSTAVVPASTEALAPTKVVVAGTTESAVDLLRRLAVVPEPGGGAEAASTRIDVGLVAAGDSFGALFAPATRGPTVAAEETSPTATPEAGTTIVLDRGVYDYARFADAHRGAFPSDLTFRGAGMDRTLLRIAEIGPSDAIRNLAFEDLTIDARGHHFADVRGDEPVAIRMTRTRVVGFDAGPGESPIVAAKSAAFMAVGSRFEAGFGEAPGTGVLFHVRGPLLARFEDCTLVGPMARVYEPSPKAAYAFVGCRFEAMDPSARPSLETPPPYVRIERATIELTEAGAERRVRTMSDLNPDWR